MNVNYSQHIECLNDLMDYFIVVDTEQLYRFQEQEGLPKDLLTEFTTQESGDTAVSEGIILPIRGIQNLPYTVFFNEGDASVFHQLAGDTRHQKSGYRLQVQSGSIHLITMPNLRNWDRSHPLPSWKPKHSLASGWYSVTVIAGFIAQEGDLEPTIDFWLKPSPAKPKFTADIAYGFDLT